MMHIQHTIWLPENPFKIVLARESHFGYPIYPYMKHDIAFRRKSAKYEGRLRFEKLGQEIDAYKFGQMFQFVRIENM